MLWCDFFFSVIQCDCRSFCVLVRSISHCDFTPPSPSYVLLGLVSIGPLTDCPSYVTVGPPKVPEISQGNYCTLHMFARLFALQLVSSVRLRLRLRLSLTRDAAVHGSLLFRVRLQPFYTFSNSWPTLHSTQLNALAASPHCRVLTRTSQVRSVLSIGMALKAC